MPPMPRAVDRGVVRVIAWKRTITGALSLVAAVALLVVAGRHGDHPMARVYLGALLFVFGGAWALRDGVRLLLALRK